jgi:glyoxylase-like metal-dependent hydrolase (beta-lactamase superfamily II)
MLKLDRRTLLAGAAAAAAIPAADVPANAAAPLAGNQNPGFYRYKVGDYEVTAILDGVRKTKLTASPSRNTSLETVQAELEKSFLPKDEIYSYFHPTLVNTGKKLILIDTGNGPGSLGAGTGRVPENIKAAGVDAKAIDTVIISHFHGDHITGLRNADGSLAYPNAEIMVPAAEWAYWMDEGNMAKAPDGSAAQNTHRNTRRIFADIANKVTKYESGGGKEIQPGIMPIDTSGHTPGHTSFIISSGNGKVCYQADVTSGFAQLYVVNPGWHPGGDMDPQKGEATRRRFYDMMAAEKMLVSGYHFTFPSLAYLEKSGGGYRMIAAPWNPSL